MTMLQAMERTDWSLKVTMVVTRSYYVPMSLYMYGPKAEAPPKEICQVCDNEFCGAQFVVVEGEGCKDIYIDVGPVCAHDIERGIKKP